MAEILPLRAWRYNDELSRNIESLTSPLFDVVSARQRQSLYQNPLNSIHLSVPQPPFAADRAGLLLNEWKKKGTITQDKLPGIYVYYQYFRLQGIQKEFCRKGFICNIRLYDWDEKVILRHENTIPKAVNDRIELLEKTELNVSPTHGLYTDPSMTLEQYMDEAIAFPLYETEDYQGVRDVLAVIHDAKVISQFLQVIKGKKIILADGHHRYEGSLANMHHQKRSNPKHTGNEGYNFHMMYLTNTELEDLRILPTHRLVHGLEHFDEAAIMEKLEADFIIKPIADAEPLEEVITGKQWTFGIAFKENTYKVRLKAEAFSRFKWPFPEEIKSLDLTVLHYFIIDKVLGIRGKEQRRSENIVYERSFFDCLKKVTDGKVQMAIITNGVTIEDVKKVCESGYTLPQKSTYFYPKVICGFLFASVNKEEFNVPIYFPFN